MNDDSIQDLKQFISATVSQETQSIKDELKSEIEQVGQDVKGVDKNLSGKIDDLSASVAEAIESSNQETDRQLSDHEKRILKLEQGTTQGAGSRS